MTTKLDKLDRRDFLKGAASVAGIGLIGVLGCESDSDDNDEPVDDSASETPDTDSDRVDADTEPKSRHDAMMFSAASIGGLELRNRLIRSATEEAYCQDGIPASGFTKIYTDLAEGGIGAIISGIAMVSEEDAVPFELYAFEDSQMVGLKTLREAVRDVDPDCKVIAQVGHTGHRYFGETRIGPSDVSWPGDERPMRALEVAEIAQIVEAFAQTTRRFKESGWDGVELHGGHAYLISSFLSPYTNKRTDQYGGSVAKRVQIVKDIVERSRQLVGDDFPIFIKLNSDDRGGSEPLDLEGGIDQEIFVATVNELAKMKIDCIDVSGNFCSQPGLSDISDQSYFKDAAAALDLSIPIILTGGNRTADDLEKILQTKEITFIGLSRPLIREPDLANRWLSGETNNTRCISCNLCAKVENIIGGLRCHQES